MLISDLTLQELYIIVRSLTQEGETKIAYLFEREIRKKEDAIPAYMRIDLD